MAYTREQYNEFVDNELTQQDRKSHWGAAVGVGLPATAFAVGFMRTKSGGRVWDVYFKALQHMEGALPMGIGATFRLSEIVSPLAAPDKFSLTPIHHPDLFKGRGVQDYLSKMTGRSAADLRELGAFTNGVEWQRTGAALGQLRIAGGGPVLASNIAALSTGPRRTGHILEWFNRVTGVKNPTFLRRIQESEDYLRPAFLPIGSKGSAGKLAAQYLYSLASSGIGRMNLLLSSPYDLPIMEEMAKKVPLLGKIKLGVKEGTGLQMLGRYAGKAAIGLGAYHGLRYADYLSREYGPAAGIPMGIAAGATAGALLGMGRKMGGRYAAIGAAAGGIFAATLGGPISGAAEVYAGARVTQAEVSDVLGLREGAIRTEEFFPGLTKPTTLVAAAGVGLLLGGVSDYYERLKVARSIGKGRKTTGASGKAAKDVYEEAEGFIKAKREALHKTYGELVEKEVGLKKLFAQVKQRFEGTLKKGQFSPGSRAGKGAVIGAAAFAGLSTAGTALAGDFGGTILTALSSVGAAYAYAKRGPLAALGVLAAPLILREKEDPEKLKRIYTGEELVAIKSGRWWEAGRTSYEGGRAYFRQHRVAMMRAGGVQEQALYGEESAYWDTDPIMSPLSWLADPYAREKLMWQQGYKFPVTKTPFEDFPIIGPMLATTLGRAIKPPKFMGRDEWMPEASASKVPEGWEELPMEDPIMRTSLRGTVGEQMYRMTELMGLPGFAMQSIKEKLTGEGSWFPDDQWATPSIVSGMEPGWWSLEMGGLAMLCIPEGSEIQTSQGNKVIEEITDKDKVLSRDGRFHSVKATSRRRETEITTVSVETFGSKLQATPNHRIPVWEFYPCHDRNSRPCIVGCRGKRCRSCSRKDLNIEVVDKPISDVRPGDWLEVPLPKENFSESVIDLTDANCDDVYTDKYIYSYGTQYFAEALELLETGESKTRKNLREAGIPDQFGKEALHSSRQGKKPRRFRRHVSLTDEMAYLVGWYAAEGTPIKTHATQFVLNISEERFARKLQRIAERAFNATSCVYKDPQKDTICLVIHSPILRRLVEILAGRGSHTKRIDPRIMYGSESLRAAFLRGYMLGDGFCNTKKRAAGISTCSRNLANQALLIGLSLGFRGRNILDYLEKSNGYYPHGDKRKDTLRHYIEWARSTVPFLPDFLNGVSDSLPSHGLNRGSFVYDHKLYVRVSDTQTCEHNECWVYDLEIEGLHYFTSEYFSVHNSEGIRRYIPNRRSDVEYRNPLPSGLPSWLPGPNSGYYLDFSRASIYSEIKEPWARLPGAGYAALNPELKGVAPEDYPSYWRFKVLADLAPWSQEYGQYDKAMSELKAQGRLTADQILQVQATRRRVKEAKRKKEFQRLKYDEAVTRQKVRITGEVEPGVYLTDRFGSAPIVLAGVDSSGASLANIAMQENASLTATEALRRGHAKRAQLSDYLRDHIYPGAEIDVFVHQDPSSLMERGRGGQATVPVVAVAGGTNVNRRLIEMGLGQEETTLGSLDPMAATGTMQRAFGSFWENLAHGAETPLESLTPVAPIAKFVHQRTALEDYQRTQVYGRDVALWQKPVEHFLAPGLKTTMWWAGWRELPADVKERYMVDEYFDRLKHMKWERLSDAARARGEGAAASKYMARAEKTITGANIFSERSAYLALGKNERVYFEQFVYSPSARERREISQYVSPQMNQVLHAQWARRAAEGAQMRAEAGIPMSGDREIMSNWNAMQSSEAEAARQQQIREQQQEMPVPGPAWVGWEENAAIDDFKVKTVNDKNMDMSGYGIWQSDLRRVERRPWVQPIGAAMEEPLRPVGNPGNIRRQFNRFLNRFGHRGPGTTLTTDGYSRMNVYDNGHSRLDRYRRDPSLLDF